MFQTNVICHVVSRLSTEVITTAGHVYAYVYVYVLQRLEDYAKNEEQSQEQNDGVEHGPCMDRTYSDI